jgi:Holliday junction resolvase RusA-like endonuclease
MCFAAAAASSSAVAAAVDWSSPSLVVGFVAIASGSGGIFYNDLRVGPSLPKMNRRCQQQQRHGMSSSFAAATKCYNNNINEDYDEDYLVQPDYYDDNDGDVGDISVAVAKPNKKNRKNDVGRQKTSSAISAVSLSTTTTSTSTIMEMEAEGGYWIDRNDPFVMMNEGEVFASGGGEPYHHLGIMSSSSRSSKEPTQQLLPQFSVRQIMHNQSSSGSGNKENEGTNLTDRKSIKFTIRGNPRVLIRHRSARGYTYNPSRPAQDDFRNCVLKLLPPRILRPTTSMRTTTTMMPTTAAATQIMMADNDNSSNGGEYCDDTAINGMDPSSLAASPSSLNATTLFSADECLQLSLTFRMKRPKSHFIANQPGYDRLKSSAPSKINIRNLRSDVDNMAKFVMDSLNGLLYVDDRQVVVLNVRKVLDCDGLCLGATDVEISVVKEEEIFP